MSTKIVNYDCECQSCKGTGLYIGFAERDGAAVICNSCNGRGWQHVEHTYETTDKTRKSRKDIKRVFQSNPGIGIGENNSERKYELSEFGGIPYKDWADDKPFPKGSEMRAFTCPAWWYQTVNYKKKPDWKECLGCGSFSGCSNFSTKELCWKRFDKENAR